MKSKLIFAVIVILSFSTFAQVPKTVLMEYATNASCGPCASTNPYSYDYLLNNYGRMVSIWYHAWWPGSDDPMYVANKIENENRINYYNINGVPNYIIDGVLKGYRTEYTDLNNDAESRFAITSPVKLDVNLDIVNDSLDVTVTMVIYGDVTQENLKLRTAIIEQMLLYDNPPGSNGEVEFPHVFRKFIDGVAGIDITNLNIGDSLTYNMKVEISPEWKKEEISIVTFLQSHSSKEVIQAATDRNLHSIRGETPKMELVSKNESINYPYTITNYNIDTLKLAISLDVLENNQNWLASLKYGGNPNDTIIISLASQEVVSFELDLYIDEVPDYIRLKISAVNIGNETNYTTSLDYLGLVKDGKILLIDDDGGRDFQSNFIRTLNKNTIGYTKIDQSL